MRPSFVALVVPDVAASARFCAEGLGLEPGKAGAEWAFFRFGSLQLAVWSVAAWRAETGLESPPPPGAVSLSVNHAGPAAWEAAITRATRAGATLLRRAPASGPFPPRAWLRCPAGHLWELACEAGSPGPAAA